MKYKLCDFSCEIITTATNFMVSTVKNDSK